ncbi:MAG: hypothetical protein K6U03_10600, partial [Firmicutes bacterium]|nr:hypothetical protein [Bacillota bacterium]
YIYIRFRSIHYSSLFDPRRVSLDRIYMIYWINNDYKNSTNPVNPVNPVYSSSDLGGGIVGQDLQD